VAEAQDTLVAIVAARSTNKADGIRDHTLRLADQLAHTPGVDVEMLLRTPKPWESHVVREGAGNGARPDAVILQYNPFWHGRRGFAPGLILTVLRLRRRARGARFALLVHENFVDPKNWRWALMSAWQRFQLVLLQSLFHVQLGTIEQWTTSLRRSWPFRPAHHLPVGSNLPDLRARREQGRSRMGAGSETVVLAAFGMHHPGRLTGHILAAAGAVARDGRDVLLLNVGAAAGDHVSPSIEGVRTYEPGFLAEAEMAELLAGADVFLAPFADGVSTRRTTVMSALQHEVAVVGTVGHLTDDILAGSDAMVLVPVGREEDFVAAVRDLASDRARRAVVARAGRQLYEDRFDWPVIARRLLLLLERPR
jgi:glycosyltransferase involved in cell wall biosynthesis